MKLSQLFMAPEARRLRAGWRLALQFLLMMALSLAFVPFVIVAATVLPGLTLTAAGDAPWQDAGGAMLAGMAISFLAITVSIYLARRLFDRRSFRSLGLAREGAVSGLLFGFVLAGVMIGFIYAVESLLGWVRFEGMAWQTDNAPAVLGNTLLWLAVFAIVGWQEELLCRGYWLTNLIDGLQGSVAGRLAVPLAALFSSLGFALLHVNNPNVSGPAIAGLLLAGLWFAFAARVAKQLWTPIGAHIGWNFFEATVFGFPVSGMAPFGVIRQTTAGPIVWTGGAFGPEAGLILLPALALGALALWGAYGRERGAG